MSFSGWTGAVCTSNISGWMRCCRLEWCSSFETDGPPCASKEVGQFCGHQQEMCMNRWLAWYWDICKQNGHMSVLKREAAKALPCGVCQQEESSKRGVTCCRDVCKQSCEDRCAAGGGCQRKGEARQICLHQRHGIFAKPEELRGNGTALHLAGHWFTRSSSKERPPRVMHVRCVAFA